MKHVMVGSRNLEECSRTQRSVNICLLPAISCSSKAIKQCTKNLSCDVKQANVSVVHPDRSDAFHWNEYQE